jgi:hypothetical protein
MADGSESFMLTTIDNPWNPFDHFDEWLAFDMQKGYATPGLLARVANVGADLPDSETEAAIQEAIDEIVELNPNGLYRKISESQAVIPRQQIGGGVLAK